jgi:hypothetical protein
VDCYPGRKFKEGKGEGDEEAEPDNERVEYEQQDMARQRLGLQEM